MIQGIHITDTQIVVKGFMKYAVEMRSDAMIYILSFRHSKVAGGDTQTA
jgi:hypothetical protein